jgi:hypothetical protein
LQGRRNRALIVGETIDLLLVTDADDRNTPALLLSTSLRI